jgi:head-tail adaptor
MQTGKLTDRLIFSRPSRGQAENGDLVTTYQEVLNTWAQVLEKSGGYSMETGSINSQTRITVQMRFRPDLPILVGDQVKWRGFEWIVENGPVVDAKRTYIMLEAVLKVETSKRESE